MQATRSRLLKGSTVQYRIIIAHLQQYSLEQKRPMHVFFLLSSISIRYITEDDLTRWATEITALHHGLHISSIPSWQLWRAGLSRWPAGLCLPACGSALRGVAGSLLACPAGGGWRSCLCAAWRGRASVDRGRDLSRWLRRREPRVLSIQSQVRSMLCTSCMHWM